ncbi:MAG: hypothetical protein QNJ31_07505 [Candidatus Caenarcaniphilales bacterium]|nr:hypothetical protein [Candidatus Caenarcaniphilales bacterium]
MLTYSVISIFPALSDIDKNDTILIQIELNNSLNFDSEIIQTNNYIYLPVKQIAKITEEKIEFNRIEKTIKINSRSKNDQVLIDSINQTITINDNQLDKSKEENWVLWIKDGFALQDEILIEKHFLEDLFDIKVSYDSENLILKIYINRPIKSLQKESFFFGKDAIPLVKPKDEKINIHLLTSNITSNTNSASESSLDFSNQLSLQVNGDAFGGTYSTGPLFSQQGTNLSFGGIQNTWRKKLKNDLGIILGDSSPNLDPLTVASNSILGVRLGTPKNLSLNSFDDLSFEGTCSKDSEVLLLFNGQTVARQVCKTGNYKLVNIPRLVGSNNTYQIIQNNTDGTQIILREELIPFFTELLPANQSRWEAFAGRPSLIGNFNLSGNNNNDSNQLLLETLEISL